MTLFRDLYKEKRPPGGAEAGNTPGYTFDVERNTLADNLEHKSGRIDFMFAMDSFLIGNSEVDFLKIEAVNFDVVTQDAGNELSNHWALEARIIPTGHKEDISVDEKEKKVKFWQNLN